VIDQLSSARFISDGIVGRTFGHGMIAAPGNAGVNRNITGDGRRIHAWHDGYRKSHGLTHERTLLLSHNVTTLVGLDRVRCQSARDRERLIWRIRDAPGGTVTLSRHFRAPRTSI